MCKVAAYETEHDYKLNKPVIQTATCAAQALGIKDDYEKEGFYCAIATDENGCLI